jgi:hypothetical protein
MAMTAETQIFTPEIEELLREIAAEPGSVLLRVPREKVKATLLETQSPIGPMTAGLSNAERELVQVHREEFAYQLRRASWVKLTTDRQGDLFISRCADGPGSSREHEPEDIERELRGSLDAKGTEIGSQRLHWVSLPLENWPKVSELCALAQRCAPSNHNRLYAGEDWALRASHRTALEIFGAALADSCSPATSGIFQSHMGYCYDAMGRLRSSVDAWRLAHHSLPHRHDVLCFWFGLAIRTGADKDISEANARIAEAMSNGFETLTDHSALLHTKRSLGYWSSNDISASSIRRWNSRLCESAKELAYALA